jgi:hypothetical protein
MTSQPSDEFAAAIAGRLPQARWFAGKGRGIGAAALADAIPLPDAVTLALVEVSTAGESSRYVMPVAAAGADVAATPAFARWLIDTVWSGATHAGERGRVVGHAVGALPKLPAVSPAVAVIGPDASNTSLCVTVGDAAFAVKLMRRCRPGIQPEVEVGAFVAERTSWRPRPTATRRPVAGAADRHGRHQSASSPGPHATHRAENGCGSAIDRTTLFCRVAT